MIQNICVFTMIPNDEVRKFSIKQIVENKKSDREKWKKRSKRLK